MLWYLIRRLGLAIVVLLGVTAVASEMTHVSADPVAVMLSGHNITASDKAYLRHALGLDQPFYVQYVTFVWNALHGDLGQSIRFERPALDLVLERLPNTIELDAAALLLAVVVATTVGILSATNPNSPVDYIGRLLTMIGQSIPIFWLGILLVLVFSVRLRWLPAGGNIEPASIILPAVALGLYPMARIARTLRASMLEVLSREYMQTARAKGLSELQVVLRHAVRNAAGAVVTITALEFGVLLGGSVVTETIFAWPGVGQLSVQAVDTGDFPLVRAIVVVVATGLILANLAADLLVAYLNPRIRLV